MPGDLSRKLCWTAVHVAGSAQRRRLEPTPFDRLSSVRNATTPLETGVRGVPIRALKVEVVKGPDAGRVVVAREESLAIGTADGNDLVLTDPTVSRYHVELARGEHGVVVVDHGSTNGTVVGTVKLDRGVVAPGATLALGRTRVCVTDGDSVTLEVHPDDRLGELRGRSRPMRRLMAQITKAAQSDVPVLLVGESGTGKELIARALHEMSPRARGPFEVVDCGALAPNLVASELFGHERGAFTGAERRHVGAFERAHGGTLFLDEIGELPPELQPALLGALERRQFRRVGGTQVIDVDVRVVSATHRDLRAAINASTFRLDLYYRLAVLVLRVPPLRDRVEDLPLLLEHFVHVAGADSHMETLFPPSTIEALTMHHWPGNVRELKNLVEATIALGETPELLDDGKVALSAVEGDPNAIGVGRLLGLPYKLAKSLLNDEFEKRYLARLLDENEGNVAKAARAAEMDRSYLFELLKRHGVR
jgi:DNA-binding NtrC family response regulator